MLFTWILLIIGFGLLIKGADWLVEGSSNIARKFGISELLIGLTIVAFGTSFPELVVNMMSAYRGNSDIALGNIVGSNIANTLLILGAAASIAVMKVQKSTVWKEIPFMVLASFITLIAVFDPWIDGRDTAILTRGDGLTLLGFFAIFLYYTVSMAINDRNGNANDEQQEQASQTSIPKSSLQIAIGLAGLYFGGEWVVSSAVTIAKTLGLSEAIIGLTIVAIGTSLPELVTSVIAALKGKMDVSVGNIIGSNIFNLLWILGLTSTIMPIPLPQGGELDLLIMFISSIVVFVVMFLGKKHTLTRVEGITFLTAYAAYLTWTLMR